MEKGGKVGFPVLKTLSVYGEGFREGLKWVKIVYAPLSFKMSDFT
jgi:hypothetical protein